MPHKLPWREGLNLRRELTCCYRFPKMTILHLSSNNSLSFSLFGRAQRSGGIEVKVRIFNSMDSSHPPAIGLPCRYTRARDRLNHLPRRNLVAIASTCCGHILLCATTTDVDATGLPMKHIHLCLPRTDPLVVLVVDGTTANTK